MRVVPARNSARGVPIVGQRDEAGRALSPKLSQTPGARGHSTDRCRPTSLDLMTAVCKAPPSKGFVRQVRDASESRLWYLALTVPRCSRKRGKTNGRPRTIDQRTVLPDTRLSESS